jgi:hypothetical protein
VVAAAAVTTTMIFDKNSTHTKISRNGSNKSEFFRVLCFVVGGCCMDPCVRVFAAPLHYTEKYGPTSTQSLPRKERTQFYFRACEKELPPNPGFLFPNEVLPPIPPPNPPRWGDGVLVKPSFR